MKLLILITTFLSTTSSSIFADPRLPRRDPNVPCVGEADCRAQRDLLQERLRRVEAILRTFHEDSVVLQPSGATFTRVTAQYPQLGAESYRDRRNLVWGSFIRNAAIPGACVSYNPNTQAGPVRVRPENAQQACRYLHPNARLPTVDEVIRLSVDMGAHLESYVPLNFRNVERGVTMNIQKPDGSTWYFFTNRRGSRTIDPSFSSFQGQGLTDLEDRDYGTPFTNQNGELWNFRMWEGRVSEFGGNECTAVRCVIQE